MIGALILGALIATTTGMEMLRDAVYTGSHVEDSYPCHQVTGASVTVDAEIKTARLTYPTLRNTVTIVLPNTWDGQSWLGSAPDSAAYKSVLRCLLGRDDYACPERKGDSAPEPCPGTGPDWGLADLDTHTEPMISTTATGAIELRYESIAEMLPSIRDRYQRIGLFTAYRDTNDWVLQLNVPWALQYATWSAITITAPPHLLNTPRPAMQLTENAEQTKGIWQLGGILDGQWIDCVADTACTEIRLDANPAQVLQVAAELFPFAIVAQTIGWVLWLGVTLWTYKAAQLRTVGARRPDRSSVQIRRLLVSPILICTSNISISVAVLYVNSVVGRTAQENRDFNFLASLALTIVVMVSSRYWGLSRIGVGLTGALSLLLLAVSGPELPQLLAAHALLLSVLLAAGCLNGTRLLLSRRSGEPWAEWTSWIGGVLIGLVLTGERALVLSTRQREWHWLSDAYPTSTDLFDNFNYYAADLLLASFGLVVLLVPLALLRIMYDMGTWAGWSEPATSRRQLLTVTAIVFFVICDWTVDMWGWPGPIWLVLLPLIIAVFRRFRSVLDVRPAGTETLRSRVVTAGMDTVRADARAWRAAVREGRSLEKRMNQGNIDTESYQRDLQRIFDDTERSRHIIQRNPSSRDLNITPMDLLLATGPNISPTENAKTAAKIAALWGFPFAILLTVLSWPTGFSVNYYNSFILLALSYFGWQLLSIIALGAVIGLLWQHLPGRRGPLRVIPLVALYSIVPAAEYLVPYVLDQEASRIYPVQILCALAVATFVGLAMDMRAVRGMRPPWQVRLQALAFAYGAENVPAQLAFVLAQASAIVAVIGLFKTGTQLELPTGSATVSTGTPPPAHH